MNARRLEVLPARGDAIMWAVLTGPVAAMFAVAPTHHCGTAAP